MRGRFPVVFPTGPSGEGSAASEPSHFFLFAQLLASEQAFRLNNDVIILITLTATHSSGLRTPFDLLACGLHFAARETALHK